MPPSPPVDFVAIESRIFKSVGERVFIGGIEVSEQMRGVLRDQARSFETSQMWELIGASLLNEAANLALIDSQHWDHVQFAKALKHSSHFINNVVHTLAK